MAWIELHQSLPTHRKTIECATKLGISLPQMVGHLCCLWLWALDNSNDGTLSQVRNVTVALASHWDGDADEFVNALLETKFLDRKKNNLVIHDWYEYAGRLLEQRKANRERQRRFRDRQKKEEKHNGDVTVTETLRNGATVPNRTIPNSTVHNNTPPIVPPNVVESDDSTPGGGVPVKEIIKAFNDTFQGTGIPRVRELTKARRQHVKREWLKQRDGLATLEDFKKFFCYLRDSCKIHERRTENGHQWFSFDWLFKYENNFAKALEGNYAPRRKVDVG